MKKRKKKMTRFVVVFQVAMRNPGLLMMPPLPLPLPQCHDRDGPAKDMMGMVDRVGWPCKEVVGLEEDSEVVVVAFSMSSVMYETGCFFS